VKEKCERKIRFAIRPTILNNEMQRRGYKLKMKDENENQRTRTKGEKL